MFRKCLRPRSRKSSAKVVCDPEQELLMKGRGLMRGVSDVWVATAVGFAHRYTRVLLGALNKNKWALFVFELGF